MGRGISSSPSYKKGDLMAENNATIAGKSPKQSLKYQRDKDKQKVKGVFHYHEVPGGTLGFFYRKYKGDQAERYVLTDGEVVTIPLGVAKHLNKEGRYPVHAHAVDANGKNIYKVGKQVRRFGFQSLEFIDPSDFETTDTSILTVEKV
jgi:hypothetical protein